MNKQFLDFGLLTPVLILVVVSLATLFSINPVLFRGQCAYFLISLAAFLFFSQTHYYALRYYALPIYIASLILLVFVLFVGFESRGAVRWIDIFGLQIQFSEILKPFLLVSLCAYISDKPRSGKYLFIAGLLLLPIAVLIYRQPDLGNALVYIGTATLLLIVFGFPFRWFLGGLLFFALMSPIMWSVLHGYQRERIVTFFNKDHDPLGVSYNAVQAIIAVGSGNFLGKGLSQGTQSSLRFLPERHTDFIFATISESLGFIGASVVIICFVFLLFKISTLFTQTEDVFAKTFCAGAFCLFLLHFFVNIGMNLGLVPIVGITLPFMSYGGSSLLSNFILLGLLSSIRKDQKNANVLEIK